MPDMEFKEALMRGLRPYANQSRNSQYLSSCINLIPTERGLRALPVTTTPTTTPSASSTWPHNQYHRTDTRLLMSQEATLYSFSSLSSAVTGSAYTLVDADNLVNAYVVPTGNGGWHHAGFQDMFLMTNGKSFVADVPHPGLAANRAICCDDDGTNACNLSVGALCNFNDRLVLGGLSGTNLANSAFTDQVLKWQHSPFRPAITSEDEAFDTNWLIISPDFGGDNEVPFAAVFSALGVPGATVGGGSIWDQYNNKFWEMVHGWIEQGRYVFLPVRHVGAILRVMQYQSDIIVYGTDGVSRVSFTERGVPMDECILDVGIAGRNALAGTKTEHVFITKHGELYMLGQRGETYPHAEWNGKGLYRLNYDEFVGGMTLNEDLMVNYDPTEKYYFMAAGDDYSFVLTRTGLCRNNAYSMTSCVRLPGQQDLVATVYTSGHSDAVEVISIEYDGEQREIWETQYVDIASDDAAAVTTTMFAKLNKGDAFNEFTGEAVVNDDRGRARVSTSGVEFKAKLTASDRANFTNLDNILIRAGRGEPSMRKWLDV